MQLSSTFGSHSHVRYLAAYDGSVVVNRTNGEYQPRCDLEAANFLALNLAHEIILGKRSSKMRADVRRADHGDEGRSVGSLHRAAHVQRALGNTADPDKPLMMDDGQGE